MFLLRGEECHDDLERRDALVEKFKQKDSENRPIKIENDILPMLIADPPKNIIALIESGTGKTTASVLLMLSRANVFKKWPQVKRKGLQ